jgi:hypothetical protein
VGYARGINHDSPPTKALWIAFRQFNAAISGQKYIAINASFIASPTNFATFITHSIDTLQTAVATQNFFAKTVCVRLFIGGIVSISLLPSSTKLIANDHARARPSRSERDKCIATLMNRYRALLSPPRQELRGNRTFYDVAVPASTIHKVKHA